MQPERTVQRDLTQSEIDRLLDRNHFVRVAYGHFAHIDIFPFNYVRDEKTS